MQRSKTLKNFPHKPGCYLYKDKSNQVIYIGKAKDLQKRISQYFQKKELDPKTKLLVSKIADVEFITTNNEVEALLLEQSLIHQYQPKYNIDLRGDIRYAYIKVTNEKFPRLITSRKIEKHGKYYGPYTEGSARRMILKTLGDIFKIRTCSQMPKKVCLQYHIGRCSGPCQGFITEADYLANIKNAERLLKGETREILNDITRRMKESSAKQQYELAKNYRDQIVAVKLIEERQKIDVPKNFDQDILNWLVVGNKIYFQLFNIDKGVITSRHKFEFQNYLGVVEDFIKQYYSINFIPREIIIPSKLEEQDLIVKYLQETKAKKFTVSYMPRVDLTVPQKGEKAELLKLVKNNLEITLGLEPGILDLQQKLGLSVLPKVIEFFDISTLQGKYNVGAMIQMVNGRFNKNEYRKFKIRWPSFASASAKATADKKASEGKKDLTEQQNDTAMMFEIVLRRYYRLVKEKGKMPDLIVIDGGKGQLNAAIKALAELKLNLNICSLAKREEEIYLPHKESPLKLDQKQAGIKLLIKGRDEDHRFVIRYHRSLRKLK
ncbi:MAG: excinuclease ABC subunit C [Candidatus Buchananbacteria bacterium RBG_13_39_9]|uniref:Excinuclease ABC subunit C n=1 Tax=Candidatus Buchananbacteria bacterium RBG_13_39_9 TaxID=1797531 RepID=A0A1G1XTT4_9BACT|nr:MAG: excinuclease ABC subunit C [Candidatus Buchananbacteria bacterium RBG_13_39_9]